MQADLAYMPFYHKDWLTQSRGLTPAARGCLMDLRALYWEQGRLVKDRLHNMVGMDKRAWKPVWEEIQEYFYELDGYLHVAGDDELRAAQLEKIEKKRAAGRIGGQSKRSGKSKADAKADASGLLEQNESKGPSNTEPEAEPHEDEQTNLGGAGVVDLEPFRGLAAACLHTLQELPGLARATGCRWEHIAQVMVDHPSVSPDRWQGICRQVRDNLSEMRSLGEGSTYARSPAAVLREELPKLQRSEATSKTSRLESDRAKARAAAGAASDW